MAIAIIDFGSQYTNLIQILIESLGVASTVLPPDSPLHDLEGFNGVILSGGPNIVDGSDAPRYTAGLFDIDLPILGICYGHQLMAYAMGGEIKPGSSQEYGKAVLRVIDKGNIFSEFDETDTVWMSHSDTVVQAPAGFVVAAKTQTCPVAAMHCESKKRFGVQFHPEVSQTRSGESLLRRFVIDVCGCEKTIVTARIIQNLKDRIIVEVGTKNVFMLVSGGIDSTVAFVLLAQALGKERVYGLHIDTGLLRQEETVGLVRILQQIGLEDRLKIVNASDDFFHSLLGIKDAEKKRIAVAKTFLDVKDKAMSKLNLDPDEWMLGQGTLYTDLITSGLTNYSKTIKTHHNALLGKRESLSLVEPLKSFYKHQVRDIGRELGLPPELIEKEPYPGPGNSVRILGKVTRQRADMQRQVDSIVTTVLKRNRYHKTLFQGFPVIAFVSDFDSIVLSDNILGKINNDRLVILEQAKDIVRNFVQTKLKNNSITWQLVLLPLKTVGIKGDNRSFAMPIAIRMIDNKTCDFVNYEILEELSSSITNKLDDITRVVYDITRKEVAESKWEVLVFLRLITSREAMTADWAKVDYKTLEELSDLIIDTTEVDRVMLDITQKPPGTVEWE